MISLRLPFPPSDNANYGVVQPGRAELHRLYTEHGAGTLPEGECLKAILRVIERMGPGRVFLTQEVREFRKWVNLALLQQLGRAPKLEGRLAVRIELSMPDLMRRDIPNYVKALLDALTLAHLWVDDEQIDFLSITRGPLLRDGCCVLDVIETSPLVRQLTLDEQPASA